MKNRRGPSFVGIGASYTALSQITLWLSEHDQISDHIPIGNFFNTEAFTKKGYDWYEKRLNGGSWGTGQLYGDVTPGYLLHPKAASRIATSYSDAKLFLVVRHPLKRALAAYIAHQTIDKSAKLLSAGAYLSKESWLQTESCYADHLMQYSEYYSPVNLHIIVYEDLLADPLKTMKELYAYLGVNDALVPKGLKQLVPPVDPPKNPGLIKLGIFGIKKNYKKITTRKIPPLFSAEPDITALLTPEELDLFKASFRPSANRLSHLMGRDMVAFWELD